MKSIILFVTLITGVGFMSRKNIGGDVIVKEKWQLPPELKEVSGIAYLSKDQFACIQDEDGIIFIFDKASGKIARKISFGGPGDYEDIALKNDIAYVLRADGKLFELNIDGNTKSAKQYNTPLTLAHNVEGLCYDNKNNRLLLAIKEHDPLTSEFKGIYAFDLSTKSLLKKPVFKIDLEHKALANNSGSKKNKPFQPSAIGIHPNSQEMYVLDGSKATLLIMDAAGNIKKLYKLGKEFKQPEGITFSPDGEVFISNEGGKSNGNIIQVEIPAD